MASDLRVEEGPVGPVVRPADHTETVVLYLPDNPDALQRPGPVLDLPERLARAAQATVICCHYRPTFPEALEDVHGGYRYSLDTGRVAAVVGERMGASLAAALLVQLRDRADTLPRCVVLVSALLDLTMESKSIFLNASADPAFDVAELQRRVADYAAGVSLTDPIASPMYANLHGLPPVQLLAASTDPLLDDTLAFAMRAGRSHLTVDLRVWDDSVSLNTEYLTPMADFITTWTKRCEQALPA